MILTKEEYEMVYGLQKCTSKKDWNPILNGVHMSLADDGAFKAHCTDKYLIGTVELVDKDSEPFEAVVKVPKLTAKYESVQIVPSYGKMSFRVINEWGEVVQEVIENTIEGDFPDLYRVIKDTQDGQPYVSLDARMLKKALEVCGGGIVDIFVSNGVAIIQGVGDVSSHAQGVPSPSNPLINRVRRAFR